MTKHDIVKLVSYPDRAVYLCACGRVGSATGAVGTKRGQCRTLEDKARVNHYRHKKRALFEGRKVKLGRPSREEKAAAEREKRR